VILACRVVESITSLSFGRESSHVTGSSQGIGKAVAIGLSQVGATVLVTGTNPEEVADAIVFLASDKATFITGQVISVNGGSTMQ